MGSMPDEVAAMTASVSKRTYINLNAVRTIAVFGVVFQHTMGLFGVPNPTHISHIICGVPSLTVLLVLSGMTMGVMQMPGTLREYPEYLRVHALPHLRVYTVFFLVQTGLVIMNYHLAADRTAGEPFDPRAIVRAYVLADGYGSVAVWYMHMMAMVVAVWPLTSLVSRVPAWAVFGALLVIACCTPVADSDLASRTLYCVAAIYLGRRAGWLRAGDPWRQMYLFGSLYIVATVPLLVLTRENMLEYHSWAYGANTMSYIMVTASRLCGALFFVLAMGTVGSRLSGLRRWFAKGAHASLYIYLMHRVVQLACFSIFVNYVRPILEPRGTLLVCAVAFVSAVLFTTISYCVGVFVRHHPRLDYFLFGRGTKPPSQPWPWQAKRKIAPDTDDAGPTDVAGNGTVDTRTSS
jgi:hypothetical protein